MEGRLGEAMGVHLTPETRSEVAPEHRKPFRLSARTVEALPDPLRGIVAREMERPGVEAYLLPRERGHGLVVEIRNAHT